MDINSFCVVSDVNLYAEDMYNTWNDYAAAFEINGYPSIIAHCRGLGTSSNGYSTEIGLYSTGGSFLVRNWDIYGINYAVYNNGAEPVMASYNYLSVDLSYDPNGGIWDFYDDSANGRVYYLPTLDDAPTDAEDDSPPLPSTELILKQNYPNPFNGATLISFYLPKQGYVKLDIFNILGQKVKTLMDGVGSAGWGQIMWDGLETNGKPVASGIYIYRIQNSENTRSRNMVYMK